MVSSRSASSSGRRLIRIERGFDLQMERYHASAVYVTADIDHGEGWTHFIWPDEVSGWECLNIDLYGHCSRRMPLRSGEGIERIEFSRESVRIRFSSALAEKLQFGPEIEIGFSIPDPDFAELQSVLEFMGGTAVN